MRGGVSAVPFPPGRLLDSAGKEPDQLAVDPDLDGRAIENLPVTVPGAAGGGAAARRVVAAELPKPLLPAPLDAAVLVPCGLGHKLELLDAIDFNESEVELVPLVGVPDKEPQEVEPGALPDEDEVG